MSRSLIIKLLVISMLGLVILAGACASSTTPAASKPAATTPPAAATPATTAPAATTPPATTPPPAAAKPIETSFTAATYTNDQYGISIMYPKKWVVEPAKAPAIFSAREGGQVPNLTVTIFSKDYQKELDAVWAAVPMTNIKYVTQGQKGMTRDGKTETQYDVYTSDYPGGIKLRSFGVAMYKGDKMISFSITTMDGLEDEALYKEVFNTVISK